MIWVVVGIGVLIVAGVALGMATATKPEDLAAARAELRQRTGLAEVDGAEGTSLLAMRELGRVRYEHHSRVEGAEAISVGYWRLEPRQPLGVRLRLIERRLVPQSAGGRLTKAAADAVTGSRRTATTDLPGPVPIGVASLDDRVLAFTDEPAAVAKLSSDPALVAQLLACPELDLAIGPEGVTLNDPTRLNLGALMGPVSALETSAAVTARATIVAHERAIALLEHVASRLGSTAAYR